jgi:hypothetical protein
MKLRVPEGCGAVSHLGRSLGIAEDNSINVEETDWAILAAHGFRPWTEKKEAPEIAQMSREELIVAAMNATLNALQAVATEEIRTRLVASEAASLPFESPVNSAVVAIEEDAESISALNRQQLFAFLRSKGVSVSLPVTNEELRAIARQATGS